MHLGKPHSAATNFKGLSELTIKKLNKKNPLTFKKKLTINVIFTYNGSLETYFVLPQAVGVRRERHEDVKNYVGLCVIFKRQKRSIFRLFQRSINQ